LRIWLCSQDSLTSSTSAGFRGNEETDVVEVRLSVYDILGREVSVLVNERKDAVVYSVRFDGSGLASGVYFYRLTAGTFVETRKLLLRR